MRGSALLAIGALAVSTVNACSVISSDECMPFEQFQLNGTLYVRSFGTSSPEVIASDQLGDVVGEINKPLPDGAARCETFALSDGQGTPPPGSRVYAINGIDPGVALAVIDNTSMPSVYRLQVSEP